MSVNQMARGFWARIALYRRRTLLALVARTPLPTHTAFFRAWQMGLYYLVQCAKPVSETE